MRQGMGGVDTLNEIQKCNLGWGRRGMRGLDQRQKKAKTFQVAGFLDKNLPDLKCVFLGVHAHRKHRKLNLCDTQMRKLYFYNNNILYVCF